MKRYPLLNLLSKYQRNTLLPDTLSMILRRTDDFKRLTPFFMGKPKPCGDTAGTGILQLALKKPHICGY